jgi:hypothetical protein
MSWLIAVVPVCRYLVLAALSAFHLHSNHRVNPLGVAAPKKKMESGYLHRDVLKPLADSPQTARADTARGVGNFQRVGF